MLFLIVFQIVITIVLTLAVLSATQYTGIDENIISDIIAVTQDIYVFLIPLGIYLIVTKSSLGEVIPHNRLSVKNVIFVIVLTALFAPIVSVISSVTALFAPTDINNEIIDIMNSLPFLLSVFAMAVMPAICEEIIFRGVLLSNYKSAGIAKAAVISGFMFGLIHGNLYQMLYAIAAGVFFAELVAYTNSIFASMLAHFLFNGVQVAASELVLKMENAESILNASPTLSENMTVIVADLFIAVITMPFLILVFRKFMDYNKNNILDYKYSIKQNKLNTLSINLEENSDNKITDVYFVISVIASLAIAAVNFLFYA